MKCLRCKNSAVISGFCKNHFCSYFETKVKTTIKKYNLALKTEKIAVACSGGKDSTVVLYLLKKFGFDVCAIAIDEGIFNYRNKTLTELKKFCRDNKINLDIFSFKKEFGYSLDRMLEKTKTKPCTVCGIFRRYLLNKHSSKFNKIATGHNMDDEAQSILMNLFLNNSEILVKLGPRPGIVQDEGFVPRIKPLYFCTEKEVLAYSFLSGMKIGFNECPHIGKSYRHVVRDCLNDYESRHSGTKKNIIDNFLKMKFGNKSEKMNHCTKCKMPSRSELCSACLMLSQLKKC